MSCDMFASIWPKYLNLVHQTVSRACTYGLGTRLLSTSMGRTLGGWRGGITIGLMSLGFCNMNFMRSGTDKMDREIHMSKE